MLRRGSVGPPAEAVEEVGTIDTEAAPDSGDGRGLEVGLEINMDLVPSTNRPLREEGTSVAVLGRGVWRTAGDDGPATGDWGGREGRL